MMDDFQETDEEYFAEYGNETDLVTKDTRTLPFSEAAEQSVIGAILLDSDVYDLVGFLGVDDFFLGHHQECWRGVQILSGENKKIDPIALMEILDVEKFSAVGGFSYFMTLMETVPSTANASSYAWVVKDKSTLRGLHLVGEGLTGRCNERGTTPEAITSWLEGEVYQLGEKRNAGTFEHASGAIDQAMDTAFNGSVGGLGTGFYSIDRLIGKMMPEDIIVLGGRPSMGKTTLGMNLAANMAIRGGVPVLVFSLEMSKRALMARMLASETEVPVNNVLHGGLNQNQKNSLNAASKTIKASPFYIDDTGGLSPSQIMSRARRAKRQHGIKFILIDYLGLMKPDKKMQSIVYEIADTMRRLKAIAKELEIPIMVLAQLNRASAALPDKRPSLTALRDSGAIEEVADIVAFVHREEYYNRNDSTLVGMADVIIAKHRNGQTGDAHLRFQGWINRFTELN